MRLHSQTGIEGSPVSSLNCDRLLLSVITMPGSVVSADCQITKVSSLAHRANTPQHWACYDLSGMAGGTWAVRCLLGVGCTGLAARETKQLKWRTINI